MWIWMTSGAVAPTAAGGSANERSVDDVVVRNLFARVGVNLRVFDSVAGLFVDLVEADFLGIESGRSKRFGGHSFRHSIATNFPLARMLSFVLICVTEAIVLRRTKLARWYDANADNPAWMRALADPAGWAR